MSIETDARQEAERRWPTRAYGGTAMNGVRREDFTAGAVWAREQGAREPSEDPCPEWQCPDLSSEDRREGKTCPDHPCTCTREPSDEEVEAALDALSRFNQWTENPRGAMRAALRAAQEVRRG